MTVDEAGGDDTDAGFFFCFTERPGQVRFGLDLDDDADAAAPALASWNDLNWKHLQPVAGEPPVQVLVGANRGLTPATAGLPEWGENAAHMASILCQNPVWLAGTRPTCCRSTETTRRWTRDTDDHQHRRLVDARQRPGFRPVGGRPRGARPRLDPHVPTVLIPVRVETRFHDGRGGPTSPIISTR